MDVSKIKYTKSLLTYNGEKILLNTPELICKSGIQKNFNKHELLLEMIDNDFLNLINSIESNNEKHCSKDAKYKSNIIKLNGKYYIKLKVPYRYNKYEVDVKSDRIYLPTIGDIKEDIRVKCKVSIPKIWHYRNGEDNYYSGSIMEVKEIIIM